VPAQAEVRAAAAEADVRIGVAADVELLGFEIAYLLSREESARHQVR
jgi:hypothetical protein